MLATYIDAAGKLLLMMGSWLLKNRYTKYSTVVITKWFTATKCSFVKWQWIFSLLRRYLPFTYHWQDLYRIWLWVSQWMSYEKRERLRFMVGPLLFSFFLLWLVFKVVYVSGLSILDYPFLILYVNIDQINPGIVNYYNRYSNLRKRENTHCHLRNGYFIAVNQFTTEAIW
jgi:hypothetical protein